MNIDSESFVALGYFLGVGLGCIGAGIGISRAVGSALDAMARQPEASGDLRTTMFIGAAFAEALAIYALISIVLWNLFK